MGSGLLSPWHIAIIVLVLLLVFGAKRLPELGRGIGHGMREFKDAVTGNSSPDEQQQPAVTTTEARPAVPPPAEHASMQPQAPAGNSQPAATAAPTDQ